MKDGSYLKDVRNQYEDYPYPARDPNTEKTHLRATRASSLDSLNHFCFEGTKDFSNNFRVLIAGGGTGDCTIYLAEQLRETNAEVVYLDMSTASMNVAKARAKARKLDNITWIHDSILNIPNLKLGQFDFITCTGVLHHLSDPDAGLSALKHALHPDGSMFIMVYGTYGRTPIYQLQDLMRRINKSTPEIEEKITNTKRTLNSLPPTNWFKFNGNIFANDLNNDIGIYDLLLHSQDRSYTVPEFYNFIEKQDLVLNTLYEVDHDLGNLIFQPKTFIKDPQLLQQIHSLSIPEQQAICELVYGQYIKQSAYISHKEKQPASFSNFEMIPTLSICESREELVLALKNSFRSESPTIRISNFASIARTPYSNSIFEEIDGENSIAEIIQTVCNKYPLTSADIIREDFDRIFNSLNESLLVFLKEKNAAKYATIPEMQRRVSTLY